jgi:hypothetical protein
LAKKADMTLKLKEKTLKEQLRNEISKDLSQKEQKDLHD